MGGFGASLTAPPPHSNVLHYPILSPSLFLTICKYGACVLRGSYQIFHLSLSSFLSPLLSWFWWPIAIFSSFHNSTYLAKRVAAYLAGQHVGEGINKRLAGLRHLRLRILWVVLGEDMEHLPSVGAKGTGVRGGDAATGAHWERFDRESGQWYTAVHV